MRILLRNIILIGIAILYCCIMSIQNRPVSGSELNTSKQSRIELNPSAVSSTLFGYSEQSESRINTSCNIVRPGLKYSFNQFTDCPMAFGKLLFTKYLSYLFYPGENPILFKSTDIIYPFHHFW